MRKAKSVAKRKIPARANGVAAPALAHIALPGGEQIPVTADPLTPAQIDAIIRAARPTYLRGELAAWRRDLMREGHVAAARAMTRLIAQFDLISRGLDKPARHELRADGPREGGGLVSP